jgi:hypothetical protein
MCKAMRKTLAVIVALLALCLIVPNSALSAPDSDMGDTAPLDDCLNSAKASYEDYGWCEFCMDCLGDYMMHTFYDCLSYPNWSCTCNGTQYEPCYGGMYYCTWCIGLASTCTEWGCY